MVFAANKSNMDIEIPRTFFDEGCKLRILDPVTKERSATLAQECQRFVSSEKNSDDFLSNFHSNLFPLHGLLQRLESSR